MVNQRIMGIGLTLVGLVAIAVALYARTASTVAARPVRLVISGAEGRHFSGSYVADGVTNSLIALAPATIGVQAREVAFEFKFEGGDANFGVAVFVDGICRTSTSSDKRSGMRGEVRYSAEGESCWTAAF